MKKKLMALLMTAVMALGLSMTAMAAPNPDTATEAEWAAWYPTEEGKNVCASEFDEYCATYENVAFPVASGNATSNTLTNRDDKAAANLFEYGFNPDGSRTVSMDHVLDAQLGGFSRSYITLGFNSTTGYEIDEASTFAVAYCFTSLSGGAGQVTLNVGSTVAPIIYGDEDYVGKLVLVAQLNGSTWTYSPSLIPIDANGCITFNSVGSSLTAIVLTDCKQSDLLVYPSVGQSVSYDGKTITRTSLYTVTCTDASGNPVKDTFASDGTFTYYFQADGTAMTNKLTYHPNGINVIYFDAAGHEVFSNFHVVTRNIEGNPVDDYCFFNVYGYQYVNTVTYSADGSQLYYINPYGRMEMNGWFAFDPNARYGDTGTWQFTGTHIGYATWDGDLARDTTIYDDFGRGIYLQANGEALSY